MSTLPAREPRGDRLKIEHRIGVAAPAEVIWNSLAEPETWPAWNPLYPQAEGKLGFGARLRLTVHLQGQPDRVIEPVVTDWIPGDRLHWDVSMMGGLVKSTRYFEIDRVSETGCIVSNGEVFRGLLGPSAAHRIGHAIWKGFEAMGEALKARAEAEWNAWPQEERAKLIAGAAPVEKPMPLPKASTVPRLKAGIFRR